MLIEINMKTYFCSEPGKQHRMSNAKSKFTSPLDDTRQFTFWQRPLKTSNAPLNRWSGSDVWCRYPGSKLIIIFPLQVMRSKCWSII